MYFGDYSHYGAYIKTKENSSVVFETESTANTKSNINYLAKLGLQNIKDDCIFCFKAYGQIRRYVARSIPERPSPDFINHNEIDSNITNARNIIRRELDQRFTSFHFDFLFKLGDKWHFKGTNEFQYKDSIYKSFGQKRFKYWYKNSINFTPYEKFKNSYLALFHMNKQLAVKISTRSNSCPFACQL